MSIEMSQFESGRMELYKRDFYNKSDQGAFQHRSKFEYTNSTETSENSEGFVFRIPLSEISIENLKIIPEKNYIIVQSNKKTIFINLNKGMNIDTLTTEITGGNLIIEVKK